VDAPLVPTRVGPRTGRLVLFDPPLKLLPPIARSSFPIFPAFWCVYSVGVVLVLFSYFLSSRMQRAEEAQLRCADTLRRGVERAILFLSPFPISRWRFRSARSSCSLAIACRLSVAFLLSPFLLAWRTALSVRAFFPLDEGERSGRPSCLTPSRIRARLSNSAAFRFISTSPFWIIFLGRSASCAGSHEVCRLVALWLRQARILFDDL